MDQQQPAQGQVQIKADEKELQGQYSNLVMIHHNLEEFTLNFIYIFPNGAQGKLLNSVIVSPGHAKRIWRALGSGGVGAGGGKPARSALRRRAMYWATMGRGCAKLWVWSSRKICVPL